MYTADEFRNQINGNRRWQGIPDIDPDEDAYFNKSDEEDNDEEENIPPPLPSTPIKIMNGSPPPQVKAPLVDYGDDDDSDSESALPSPPPKHEQQEEEVTAPPPKRRREKEDDDEEDELGKLSRGKRRSPTGGVVGMGAGVVGRKRSFGLLGSSGGVGGNPMKRIAISIGGKRDAAETETEEQHTTTPMSTELPTTTATEAEELEEPTAAMDTERGGAVVEHGTEEEGGDKEPTQSAETAEVTSTAAS